MPSGTPKIGSTLEPRVSPGEPVPDEAHAEIMGMDLQELELLNPTLTRAPEPPKCVMKRLRRSDHVWRWLSTPHVKFAGMRNYQTVSPTEEEKRKIDDGDAQAGVFVSPDNRICWREDSWLAAIPRRLYELRQAQRRMRTTEQTKRSLSPDALTETISRMGGKVSEYAVDRWEQQGE
jgi:hypothetical protein